MSNDGGGVEGLSLKAKLCVASRVFKPDVLRIHLSDFDAPLGELRHVLELLQISWFGAVRQGSVDASGLRDLR